jgi:hypothetical protein
MSSPTLRRKQRVAGINRSNICPHRDFADASARRVADHQLSRIFAEMLMAVEKSTQPDYVFWPRGAVLASDAAASPPSFRFSCPIRSTESKAT